MSARGPREFPLFDPGAEQEVPAAEGTRERPFTISGINTAARELMESSFPDVWVQAEISNFKAHGSGHFYFCLKDARAQINAVMFRSANALLRFKPADGMSVLSRGRLTLYEARGSYQLNVQWMEPLGLGSLQAAFEQLKARLRAEGLFESARKRPIPGLPRRIGIVTSPTGAALKDILRVLERRHAGLHVVIAPCRVQGGSAAGEIAAAIASLNRAAEAGLDLDVLIVGRGGGSLEDLWAFNEEIVARAIAASRLPVISAVGHEVDVTIADFVADLRAPTPSAAAEMVVKSREELLSRVASARARLAHAARFAVMDRRTRVHTLARSRAFGRVEAALGAARQRCDEATMRMGNALLARLRRSRERAAIAAERLSPRSLRAELASRRGRLAAAAERLPRSLRERVRGLRETLCSRQAVLGSLSPLAVLDRGYAICQDPATGRVLTDAALAAPGDAVSIRLARGRLGAVVETAEPADDGGPAPGRRSP
ncbi:MAG TPA: exodeoxyribonuclease VII large subunit [Candidatus Polarisedimenticolia bacterium]|nr:exodeoxyribonuclease VII large subunit [Candidatus Polarisedimenticolia bacterium]